MSLSEQEKTGPGAYLRGYQSDGWGLYSQQPAGRGSGWTEAYSGNYICRPEGRKLWKHFADFSYFLSH